MPSALPWRAHTVARRLVSTNNSLAWTNKSGGCFFTPSCRGNFSPYFRSARNFSVQRTLPRGHARSGCKPLLVALKFQPELVVGNSKIPVPTVHDHVRPDHSDFLRHHTDIRVLFAVIDETVKAKAIVEMAEQRDVVLEPDIGA